MSECNCQQKSPKPPCPVHAKAVVVEEKRPVGRPLKYSTPEEMQVKIDEYFATNEKVTITGLALALDVDRDTLVNYEKRDQFFGTIKRAKQRVERTLEEQLNYVPAVTGVIFNLKNNFGWKDKTETDVTSDGKSLNLLVYKPEKYADPDS